MQNARKPIGCGHFIISEGQDFLKLASILLNPEVDIQEWNGNHSNA